jgi:hypothetical protein
MKDHLIFDTTNATTRADTDNVGAFVRAGDDGTVIGHVSDALKVNLSNTSIAVTASDLDIRNLVFADDKVDASGSVVALDSTTLAALESITVQNGAGASAVNIQDGGNSITVDGTVTITDDANKVEDAAHASGDTGKFVLAVRNDANTSLVSADGDYAPLQVNAAGELKVAAQVTVNAGDAEFLEDSAHASGDAGLHMLAVRQDTLAASTSADGDYSSLKVNALGRLYVDVGTIATSDAALANTAIASAAETLDAANTAQNVVASPLANRKYLWIYNKDNQGMFVGQSGVTAATGFPISPGSYMELRAGAAVDVEYVSSKINHEIRTLELS